MKLTKQNYVDLAEKKVLQMKDEKEDRERKDVRELVTTSKIRGILSMMADIYNDVQNDTKESLNEEICSRIDYLRVRLVYDAGKEKTVKHFVYVTELLECIKNIQGKRSEFILFYHYMEALVAYFKFYGLDKDI